MTPDQRVALEILLDAKNALGTDTQLMPLIRFAPVCAYISNGIFYGDFFAISVRKTHKNSAAASRSLTRFNAFSPYLSTLNHRFPDTVKYVHGGCAINKSHSPLILCSAPSIVVNVQSPLISGNTSPKMCHSGCPPDGSCMSALYASCPLALNALHTVCDSSQATNTLILPNRSFLFRLFSVRFAPILPQLRMIRNHCFHPAVCAAVVAVFTGVHRLIFSHLRPHSDIPSNILSNAALLDRLGYSSKNSALCLAGIHLAKWISPRQTKPVLL